MLRPIRPQLVCYRSSHKTAVSDHKTSHICISGKEGLSDALRTALGALSGTTGKTIRYTRPLRCGVIARCHDTNIGLFCAPRTVLLAWSTGISVAYMYNAIYIPGRYVKCSEEFSFVELIDMRM